MTSAEHAEFNRLMEATFSPNEVVVLEAIARVTIAHLERAGVTKLVSLAKVRPTHGGYSA